MEKEKQTPEQDNTDNVNRKKSSSASHAPRLPFY